MRVKLSFDALATDEKEELMKTSMLAGALAMVVWGGAAGAQTQTTGVSQPTQTTETKTGEKTTTQTTVTAQPSDSEGNPSAQTTTTMTTTKETATAQPATPAYVQPQPVYTAPEEKDKVRGFTLMAGGGVEGYTGDLAPQINAGPSWRVTAAAKPTKVLGIELAYSGAVNELKGNGVVGLEGRGADIVRNGVDALATLALSATPVQPYVLGGFGVSRYSVRDGLQVMGFQSDTSERIPLGGGLRTHFGQFTADARFDYHLLINENFATRVSENSLVKNSVSGGSYQGTVAFGATF
jgi:hypothetical protein